MPKPVLTIAGLMASVAVAGGLNAQWPEDSIFDYIVVGGGPGGLTVASRLSEDPSLQVLLLEAGDADHYEEKIMIPYMQGSAGLVNGACGGYNWCDVRLLFLACMCDARNSRHILANCRPNRPGRRYTNRPSGARTRGWNFDQRYALEPW